MSVRLLIAGRSAAGATLLPIDSETTRSSSACRATPVPGEAPPGVAFIPLTASAGRS